MILYKVSVLRKLRRFTSCGYKFNIPLFASLFLTAIFFYPSLRAKSRYAGLLFSGDVLGWYYPILAKIHSLISGLHFSALDFSTYNGSSEFFLTPNFFPFHPLVLLYGLLIPSSLVTFQGVGVFLVLLLCVHCFLASYFGIKYVNEFYNVDLLYSLYAGTTFAFSYFMVSSLCQPPFFLCAALVPWIAYSVSCFVKSKSFKSLFFASFPAVCCLLSGYMPLAFACIGISYVMVFAWIVFSYDQERRVVDIIYSTLLSAMPFLVGCLIVSPFIFAMYFFHKETLGAGAGSLFYSAHQLSLTPHSIISIFSPRFQTNSRIVEFSVYLGFIPLTIMCCFFCKPSPGRSLVKVESLLSSFFVLIYFLIILASFGDYSPISDFVYYFIPQVGRMHIYQRFFLPAQMLITVVISIFLKDVVAHRPQPFLRLLLFAMGFFSFALSYMLAYVPDFCQKVGINEFLVLEFLVCTFFISILIFAEKKIVCCAAIIFCLLPSLDHVYNMSLKSVEDESIRMPIALDNNFKETIFSFMKGYYSKKIVRYMDVTPMWDTSRGVEYFPKIFPYFDISNSNIVSYTGFTFYLASRAEYLKNFPVQPDIHFSPNWDYLVDTDADFLVEKKSNLNKELILNYFPKANFSDLLSIPNDLVIVPLHDKNEVQPSNSNVLYDDGIFKVFRYPTSILFSNISVGKQASQLCSTANLPASLITDGNNDGNFANGTVVHSCNDCNAWFDIDLGGDFNVSKIKIWNRTDGASNRLKGAWIFISSNPFLKNESAVQIQHRNDVYAVQCMDFAPSVFFSIPDFKGRYVRLQLPGDQKTGDCFLNIAELEVFSNNHQVEFSKNSDEILTSKEVFFNFANYAKFSFSNTDTVLVSYLFNDNPRLSYYLDSKQIEPIKMNGAISIPVPKGDHCIEVKYNSISLQIFVAVYSLYCAFIFSLFIASLIKRSFRFFRG